MAFINTLHRVIRKSNRDILNFYITNNNLFIREFNFEKTWNSPVKLMENLDDHLFTMDIDDDDKIYGIAAPESGNVLYFYTDDDNIIKEKTLFSYDSEKYNLIYPYIKKSDSTLHLIYFFQSIHNENTWTLFSHYFHNKKWYENSIDVLYAYPFVSPFVTILVSDTPNIFYLKDEEIFTSSFNAKEKAWTPPLPITATLNKKMYFSIFKDEINVFHITWSEFIDDNLIIRYTNGIIDNGKFNGSQIINLSQPSNCSYPSIIKLDNILWTMWVQLDKLYSSYSIDNGITWSETFIDPKSLELDFIRYKFISNYVQDSTHFKVDNIFGTFKPKISFIGFDRNI